MTPNPNPNPYRVNPCTRFSGLNRTLTVTGDESGVTVRVRVRTGGKPLRGILRGDDWRLAWQVGEGKCICQGLRLGGTVWVRVTVRAKVRASAGWKPLCGIFRRGDWRLAWKVSNGARVS